MEPTPIPKSWLIYGELPLGLVSFLSMAAASGAGFAQEDCCHRIEVTVHTPIRGGNLLISAADTDDDALAVEFVNAEGPGRIEAQIRGSGTVSSRCHEQQRSQPEDLVPYLGGLPGPARLFEVRPDPIVEYDRGTANAWVRPRAEASWDTWSVLTAIDAWASPRILDRARDLLCERRCAAPELPPVSLRSAVVMAHPASRIPVIDEWVRRTAARHTAAPTPAPSRATTSITRFAPAENVATLAPRPQDKEPGWDAETGVVSSRSGEILASYLVERSLASC
ncbi:MAG: hypothetical protein AAF567_16755 [Actinomycetota bacterium]